MKYLEFLKMHGTGNDFIMIDGRGIDLNYKKIAPKLCLRHFGIGADGLIVLNKADNNRNDFKMRIFNSDGTEAEMCGNGIRCLTHFIKFLDLNQKKFFNIETLAGIINSSILSYNKDESIIKVNMGKAILAKNKIPVKTNENYNKNNIIDYKIHVHNKQFLINSVSLGNPHTVIFTDDINTIPLEKWGKAIENHGIFPQKTNVEFVEVEDKNNIKMRVWERGVGETLACGTGACASAVISAKKNHTKSFVNVKLKGGNLKINTKNDTIFMSGKSKVVYQGKIKL